MDTFTRSVLEHLKPHANPDCPICQGEGYVCVAWNGNPDRVEDEVCACVDPGASWRHPREEEDA